MPKQFKMKVECTIEVFAEIVVEAEDAASAWTAAWAALDADSAARLETSGEDARKINWQWDGALQDSEPTPYQTPEPV